MAQPVTAAFMSNSAYLVYMFLGLYLVEIDPRPLYFFPFKRYALFLLFLIQLQLTV